MNRDGYAERVVAVAGAGSGIGGALAVRLAAPRVRLALWDVDGDRLDEVAQRCRAAGAQVRAEVVDVRDAGAVDRAAAASSAAIGVPRLLVCAAGVILGGDVQACDLADLRDVLDVNLWGTVHVVRAHLPRMQAAGGGRVVTFSSAFGLVAVPGYSAYCASKAAVRAFSEALGQELALARSPVGVTCVVPGGVRTPIVRRGRFAAGVDAAAVTELFEQRLARTSPEEAAEVILRGAAAGRSRVLVGADARAVDVAVRVLGASYQRLLPALLRRALRRVT